jgi:hypothetical protein
MGGKTVVGWLLRRAAGLRFPTLTLITFVLFAVNLAVPDAIPFVDELLMGLGALLLASARKRRGPEGDARVPTR